MSARIGEPGFTWEEYFKDQDARETAASIHDGEDGPFNRFPRCPWCGDSYEDWWDGHGFQADGDECEMECGACNKKYVATMCIETSFQSVRVTS